MTNYNVWKVDSKSWVKDLSPTDLGMQDPLAPENLTYPQARSILQEWRTLAPSVLVEVRELLPDGITPGASALHYNVWMGPSYARWTNDDINESPDRPTPLSYERAEKLKQTLYAFSDCAIMEIGSDWKPQPIYGNPDTEAVKVAPTIIIEDKQPEAPAFDWNAYNSTLPGIPEYNMFGHVVRPDVDLYTGLPKDKKDK